MTIEDWFSKIGNKSATMEDVWKHSRIRTGRCHECNAVLGPDEDFTLCDLCWPIEEGDDNS